jgi:SAM-dependent methyltransferase
MLGRIGYLLNDVPLYFFIRTATSILDVGCGVHSPLTKFIHTKQRLDGVDISEYAIGNLETTAYGKVYQCDIRDFTPERTYDIVTAIDFIEHLEKREGEAVLKKLEAIAARKVIIITPNGFVPQAPEPDNPFQEHKSGWSVAEFRSRGYRVYGMYGPKGLREGPAVLRYRPKVFWGLVATFACLLYFWMPERSFSLLAVYDKPT